MTAGVQLDNSMYWALIGLSALASLAAIVAAAVAWRAMRTLRVALGQLAKARQDAADRERELRASPRGTEDAAATGRIPAEPPTPSPARLRAEPSTAAATPPAASPVPAPMPAAPPRAAGSAPRTDTVDDPDHPGFLGPGREPPAPAQPAARTGTPAEALRTEPLERPRAKPSAASPPDEREVHPGVFVTTPGRLPAPPPAAPAKPGGSGAPATDRRLERLNDPDPFVRMEAIEQLQGNQARVEVLVRVLDDEFPVVRRQAVRSLRRTGGPVATKALLDVASQDPSAEVRQEAVDALGAMLRDVRSSPA
jgi:hypothetical protein